MNYKPLNQATKQDETGGRLAPVFLVFCLLTICFSYLLSTDPALIIPFCITVFCIFSLLPPEWAYYFSLIFIFIASFFFEMNQNDKIRPEFLDFFILCSAISWCFRGMARERKPYSPNKIDLTILFFFTWAVTSLLWTPEMDQGIFEIIKLFTCVAVYILAKSLSPNKLMLRKTVIVLTVIAVLEAVLSLVSVWIDTGYEWGRPINADIRFQVLLWAKKTWVSDGGRGTGTAVAHTIGALLNMVLFPAIGYFLIAAGRKEKWVWAGSVIIMTAGMVSTLTKSSMVSFLLGSFFILIHIRKLRGYLVVSCLLVLVLFITLIGISRIRDIETSINFTRHQMDAGDSGTSLGTRLDWWGTGFDKLVETSGLGYGIGGFKAAVDNVVPDGSHHGVLFDLGFIGFSLYIFIFGCSFSEYYRCLRSCQDDYLRKLMLTYLAGYIVMVISWLVTLYYTYAYIWFYMGFGYAIIALADKAEAKHSADAFEHSFIAMPTDPVV